MKQVFAKLKNWLWYHKIPLLVAAAVLIVGGYLHLQDRAVPEADYHIGLVSTAPYSPEQLAAFEGAAVAAGRDQNGDGQVLVHLHIYAVDLESGDAASGYDRFEIIAALDADLVGTVSGIFLLEDPDAFQTASNGLLAQPFVPWQEGLSLALRSDAGTKYLQLFENMK